MQITTAPSLLLGLGTRLFLNKFLYHYDNSTMADFVFLGLWQGTAVYCLLMHQVEFAWAAAVGILGRLLFDFAHDFDTNKCACTLLGVALGVLCTDVLSQFIEDDGYDEGRLRTTSDHPGRPITREPNRRLVQFSSRSPSREPVRALKKEKERDSHRRERKTSTGPAWELEARSIITAQSISSSSDLVNPKESMTPLQREVATLRAKASLADTERRRFKEEKKWAKEQGNEARATQMGWQVRRYATLMESFHKEADAKLLESSGVRPVRQSSDRERRESLTQKISSKPKPVAHSERPADRPTVVNIDFGPAPHRRRSSGTLKPAIRVQGREIRDPAPSNPKR